MSFYYDKKFFIFLVDQYIGNMVKANVIYGMQEYLGDALTNCDVSTKIGNIPISVGVWKKNLKKILIPEINTLKCIHVCIHFFIIIIKWQFKEPIYGSVDTTFIHYASAAILCL